MNSDPKFSDLVQHDQNIGGRFSIFSITGLLPLIVMGYSLNSLLKSFTKAKMKFLNNHSYLSKLTLSNLKFEDSKKLNNLVGLSYHDRINVINEWYRQIFAESLGKNKKAKNYISAYGSIDQHSQFQLYIDGPHDKQFIFFSIASKVSKLKSNSDLIKAYNLASVLEKSGIKNVADFLTDPAMIPPPPPDPNAEMQMQMAQQQMQLQERQTAVAEMKVQVDAQMRQMKHELDTMKAQQAFALQSDKQDLNETEFEHKEFVNLEELEIARTAEDVRAIASPNG